MKEVFGKAKLSQEDLFRIFGGELCRDGSFIIPLNDMTTVPVLDAMLRSSK